MKTRTSLNLENYQQAVKFAENLPDSLKAEYLSEAEEWYQFEQQAVENSQKFPLNKWLVLGLLGLIGALSIGIYWQSNRYAIVQTGTQLHQSFEVKTALESKEQKNHRYILSLQDRLRADPNDGDLWYELGQAYMLNNDFPSAMVCYENAQKVLGEKAAILGAMATANYYQHQQKLTENAQRWLEQALKSDPKESASLLLLAANAYQEKQYQQAIHYWRTALDSDNDAIDRRAIIQSIEMARQKLR